MDFKTIKFELLENGIGIISLNRPDKLNAMSLQLFEDLHTCLDHLMLNLDCRIVILRGEGRAFCAGLDLREMNMLNSKRKPEEYKKFYYLVSPEVLKNKIYFQWRLSHVIIKMRRISQPIIAIIQGAASGGGFALALASDIRIAGKNARFNNAFIKLALSGSDVGTSYFLPRLLGLSRATEILYSGRYVDAKEAERIGLISRLVQGDENDLLAVAMEIAEDLLAKSPLGLRMTKKAIDLSQDSPSLETLIQLENRAQMLCSESSDLLEGIAAFFDKRKPKFPLL